MPVYLQRQRRQSRHVSVVAALVPHAGDGGNVGAVDPVFDGKAVHLGAEGHPGQILPRRVFGVKPLAPVHDLQLRALPQQLHEIVPGPKLLI